MEIFKAIESAKTYAVIPKANATKDEAVKIANTHYRIKKEDLKVEQGNVEGDFLYLEKGDYWVVSRRDK